MDWLWVEFGIGGWIPASRHSEYSRLFPKIGVVGIRVQATDIDMHHLSGLARVHGHARPMCMKRFIWEIQYTLLHVRWPVHGPLKWCISASVAHQWFFFFT